MYFFSIERGIREMNLFEQGWGYIIGVTIIIGIILAGKKLEVFGGLLMRASVGSVLLYFGNMVCSFVGVPTLVGLNVFTVLCSAVLGVPGILGLYVLALL